MIVSDSMLYIFCSLGLIQIDILWSSEQSAPRDQSTSTILTSLLSVHCALNTALYTVPCTLYYMLSIVYNGKCICGGTHHHPSTCPFSMPVF